jgi:hypothetical protein
MYGRSGCLDPCVLDLSISWKRVVSFTLEFQNAVFEMQSGKLITTQNSLVAVGDQAARFVDSSSSRFIPFPFVVLLLQLYSFRLDQFCSTFCNIFTLNFYYRQYSDLALEWTIRIWFLTEAALTSSVDHAVFYSVVIC